MSLLIKNVQIIDGEGHQGFKADVLVQKNIISAIGDLKHKKADDIIDGLNNYLVPGFIDVDTDSDHYLHLFTNPGQSDFVRQGITTTIGGHCGASLAPLLYGTLESVEKWADPTSVNVNWHTVAEFLSSLRRLPLGVNFGTLVGHGTIRRALVGDKERELTEQELKVFEKIIKQAMNEGAFGFSTGLGYIHTEHTSEKEIKRLVGVIHKTGGIYTTHLRSQTNALLPSIQETVRTANYNEVKTLISHLRPLKGFEESFEEALEYIKNNTSSDRLYFDIYPHDISIYPIYTLLPEWARRDTASQVLAELRDPQTFELIKRELLNETENLAQIQIASAPKNGYLVGKTLAEAAEDLETSIPDALITVMTMTNMRATVFIKDVNYDVMLKALAHERAFIASNGNSPEEKSLSFLKGEFLKHERSTNTFPKFLNLVAKHNLMPFEQAVKKITSDPARYFDLKSRGVIKEGKVADMVLLNKDTYEVKETIVGGIPSLMKNEFVGGEILVHK